MMAFKDITSYNRDDKERKPTTFEAREGALRIVITCGHIHYRQQWVMHCTALAFDTFPLKKSVTKEQAENEALTLVHERLMDLAKCAAKMMPNAEITGG
jgi:hypothetical protein